MYRLNLITAPASEPVTNTEAKAHMRITTSSDDDYITGLIKVARQFAEKHTRRAFVNQTWRMFLDNFPSGFSEIFWDGIKDASRLGIRKSEQKSITMPLSPLSSITSIKYYDTSATSYTLSTDVYQVSAYTGDAPPSGRISLKYGQSWPGQELQTMDGVEITFVAGYGANASDVPVQIRQAILEMVSFMYENRGDCLEIMPKAALVHLEPYILRGL